MSTPAQEMKLRYLRESACGLGFPRLDGLAMPAEVGIAMTQTCIEDTPDRIAIKCSLESSWHPLRHRESGYYEALDLIQKLESAVSMKKIQDIPNYRQEKW
jgi:hypothetical protein